jgi:type I restriction enzyme S subunit
MNAERLLALYERVAEAPDAIARLRRFILDLAVRGKLVPQDPQDEPASELLKRIAKEKARLVKLGLARKLEIEPVAPGDQPFAAPSAWIWTRLGSIGDWGSGSTPPRGASGLYGGSVTWLKSGELNDNRALAGSEETVTEAAVSKGSFRLNKPGDVLIAMYGATIGKVAILAESAVTNQAVCGCTPFAGVFNQFLFLFLLSQREQFHSASEGGAQPNISKIKIVWTPFPLPPLAEQHRIVAKVDELMALCDQLEAARQEREARRDRLAAASLARLNAPDPETFQSDARFALDALPALTTRPNQIKQLRQTILNLAVRGKLMPQDPQDEPASELLKRITKAKAERKKKTGDVRIKIDPDPMPGELDMQLPLGWAVQSFENLFLFIDYRGNTPPKTDDGIPLITAKNIRMGYLNREPREYISKATFKTWMTRGFPEIGDLFFTTEAPLANICLNDIEEPFALAQRVICFQPYAKINTKFLMFALMSDVMQSLIDKHATGMTAKGIKAANLKPRSIPIPPLAEQHRIVAKVDELMALCDRLEASLTTSDQTRTRLLEATLAEALAPASISEMEAAE